MRVEAGTVVDRYTFEVLLGTGGMAAVYRARHNQLGSLHAIKVLMLPSPSVQARLLQEGRAQSRVQHPNIVTVTDVIEVGGAPGLVMQYVSGPSLQQLLEHEVLSLKQADQLARGILRGVAAAHREGLIHRDLKPGNVMLAPTDGGLLPKITDFGLAKALRPGVAGQFQTRSGLPMGTPSYMAPEQIRDAANVDARADVWALGCILYELVCRRRAFAGSDVVDTYRMVSEGKYVPPREFTSELPDRMEKAIVGALRIDLDERIADVPSLLEIWRGGVDVSENASIDPGLVERARELAELAIETAPPPSGPVYSGGGSEETWADPGLGLDSVADSLVQSEAPTAPASGPGWGRALIAAGVGAGLLALAAVALVGPQWQPEPEPEAEPGFTATSVPPLLEDPVMQRELEAGYRALLDADFEEAERRLAVVVEGGPTDPAPWLLYSRVLHYTDRHGESVDALWKAVEMGEDSADPVAELAVRAGDVRKHSWSAKGPDLVAWIEQHPDDYLAHLVGLGSIPATEREVAEKLFTQTRDLGPSVALVRWLEARRRIGAEEFDAAEAALRAGLEANPRAPTLLVGLGDVLLRRGRFEEARDALLQALEQSPGDGAARTRLASAWLMLGSEEDVRRTTEQMTQPPTSWSHQAQYSRDLVEVYAGLGRLSESTALARSAGEAAADRSEWTTAVMLYGLVPVIYMNADMVLPMVDGTVALVEMSHQPELPDPEREMLVRNLLYAEGIKAVRTGKPDEADEILARLRGLDRVWPVYIEWLERELAVSRAQPDKLVKLFKTIPPGCDAELERIHFLWRGGAHEGLAEALDARLSVPEGCSQVGFSRFQQAVAHVTRAELAELAGDRELALSHLDEFDALWPSPDGDIPAVQRAGAVRIRLGP